MFFGVELNFHLNHGKAWKHLVVCALVKCSCVVWSKKCYHTTMKDPTCSVDLWPYCCNVLCVQWWLKWIFRLVVLLLGPLWASVHKYLFSAEFVYTAQNSQLCLVQMQKSRPRSWSWWSLMILVQTKVILWSSAAGRTGIAEKTSRTETPWAAGLVTAGRVHFKMVQKLLRTTVPEQYPNLPQLFCIFISTSACTWWWWFQTSS